MELILWRESFNTGHSQIDNQHKNLVRLINELFNILGVKYKNEKISSVFNELVDYTIDHFTIEEKIMDEVKYPMTHEHKDEHTHFVNKINTLKSQLANGDSKVTIEALNFLKDWLLNHIIGSDKRIFDHINNQNIKK